MKRRSCFGANFTGAKVVNCVAYLLHWHAAMATSEPDQITWRLSGGHLYATPPLWKLHDEGHHLTLRTNAPSFYVGLGLVCAAVLALFVGGGLYAKQLPLTAGVGIPLTSFGAFIFLLLFERERRAGPWLRCDLEKRTVAFPRHNLTASLDSVELWQVVKGELSDHESVSELNAIVREGDSLRTISLIGAPSDAAARVGRELERRTGRPCEVRYATKPLRQA